MLGVVAVRDDDPEEPGRDGLLKSPNCEERSRIGATPALGPLERSKEFD